ncbi:hypothetical protein GF324_00640, partial [bacterium]|nr:hypothetical protein [bacterium]
ISAVSYTGSQVGIITDTRHGEARIVDIRPVRLLEALESDKIVVVAGFQGVSIDKEITTLGRGGSDTTAVALAAAIDADRCELMKDVDGLYSADPSVVPQARCIEKADYESALRLCRSGTVALQPEAVRIAQEHRVPLGVGNTAKNAIGTIITDAPYDSGEVVGIARRDHLVREQGVGQAIQRGDMVRLTEHRGRWVLWREGRRGEQAPLSALSLVTSGRPVPGLPEAVRERLDTEGIADAGYIESPEEFWVSVRTDQADAAVRSLHELCVQMGWIQTGAPREVR